MLSPCMFIVYLYRYEETDATEPHLRRALYMISAENNTGTIGNKNIKIILDAGIEPATLGLLDPSSNQLS